MISAGALHLVATPIVAGLVGAAAFGLRLRSKPEIAIQGVPEWVSIASAGAAVAAILLVFKLTLGS
jgi:hypothetical protein